MIRLSKLSDYAVVVLSQLATRPGEQMSACELAHVTSVPEPTVAKVLKLLSRQNIVMSTRGVNGGYAMHRAPNEITVKELITALEGPIALTECVTNSADSCVIETLCPMRGGWQKVNDAVHAALNSVMLSDLLILPLPAATTTVMKEVAHGA
jgi:FeS assembly SUF system regulator